MSRRCKGERAPEECFSGGPDVGGEDVGGEDVGGEDVGGEDVGGEDVGGEENVAVFVGEKSGAVVWLARVDVCAAGAEDAPDAPTRTNTTEAPTASRTRRAVTAMRRRRYNGLDQR
jgi:hypothetical protein